MKKNIIVGGILLVVVLVVWGFFFLNRNSGVAYDESINPEEQNDYVGESTTIIHKDFRAIMKSDWEESEVSSSFYNYFPPNTDENDVAAEFIYITISPLGNDSLTLDEMLDNGVEASVKIIPDFELIENVEWENNDLVGKKIKFTGTQEGVMRNNVQVFGIKYNNLYAMIYSCPIDSCNFYAVYNVLIESFKPVELE